MLLNYNNFQGLPGKYGFIFIEDFSAAPEPVLSKANVSRQSPFEMTCKNGRSN